MKTVQMEIATLDACVDDAQAEQVMIMRDGKPVALVIGVGGLDTEQVMLGANDAFWRLIEARREQQMISRSELEQILENDF